MLLNHLCARLVTEGGLCRKLECTGFWEINLHGFANLFPMNQLEMISSFSSKRCFTPASLLCHLLMA